MLNISLEFALKRKNMWEALNRSEVKSKKFPLKIMTTKVGKSKCLVSNSLTPSYHQSVTFENSSYLYLYLILRQTL